MAIRDLNDIDAWQDFSIELEKLHPHFLNSLTSKYPLLDRKPLKVCALLLIDSNSKEIAKKLGIQPHSVDNVRRALRKMFGLKNRKDKIITHLRTFVGRAS
ncbi:MAG: hypothetical protein WCH46_08180 [bacterium]